MKTTIKILLLLLTITGCDTNGNITLLQKKADTVYLYYNDTLPKLHSYAQVYSNFTETRKVTFDVIREWHTKTYAVAWYLWIDGDIAESNPDIFTHIQPEAFEKYKAKIQRQENDRIPKLLNTWK